MVLKSGNNTLR
jgi:predicted XRE-type DNA-binding protein